MDRKVLVTGAAGFIGSAVVRELSSSGTPVVAVDALLGGLYPPDEKAHRFSELSKLPSVQTHQLDLRFDDLSILGQDITHVINEAAMPGLGLSWSDFELYSSCNINAVARLIDAAQSWPIERFVQISTSSVYGKTAVGDEAQPTHPVSPYGATKLAAEQLVLAHWRDRAFPATILRYFSVFGPGQRPDMAYRKFISKALANEEIHVFGDGLQSRSNTYIDDCVSATISAIDKGAPGELYNVAGREERSLREALEIIEAEVAQPLKLVFLDRARGDQNRTFGDSTKAQKVLGFDQTLTLEEGLAKQVHWQKNSGLY